MRKLLLNVMLLWSTSLLAYSSGNSPWCAADNQGNLNCYYYTYRSCIQAVNFNYLYVQCVSNPY